MVSLTAEELAELGRFFRAGGIEKIEVFAYVRTPKSFMESNFQEKLKNILSLQPNQLELNALYPHYRRRFSQFIEVFGGDSVHFRRFAPERFPKRCVVHDFCAHWDIPLVEPVKRMNESLSCPAVAALYAFRQFGAPILQGPLASQINGTFLNFIARLPGPQVRFSPDWVAPVLKAERDDIAWMEAQLGESLVEDFSPTPHDIQDFAGLLRFDAQVVADLMGLVVEDIAEGLKAQQIRQAARQVVVPKLPPVKFYL